MIARYHSKLPSRCPGSTFPKEKLRVVPLASVVWTKVSRSCFTVRKASLMSRLAITMFSFSRLSKKTVGKTLEMILPEAGLNSLSLSGSNQANSRATNLDLLSHIASPFELCFSKLYRSQKIESALGSEQTGDYGPCCARFRGTLGDLMLPMMVVNYLGTLDLLLHCRHHQGDLGQWAGLEGSRCRHMRLALASA